MIAPNCTIWSSELNQKGFFLFSRVTYHTRRDQRVPPSNFFRHCETFFPEFFFLKWSPLQFFCCFAAEWMLENPKGSPLSVFFGTVRFLSENKNFSPFNFLMFYDKTPSTATKMLTISEVSPFQRARGPGAPLSPFF